MAVAPHDPRRHGLHDNTSISEPGGGLPIQFTYNPKNLLATTVLPTTTPVTETRNYTGGVLRQVHAARGASTLMDYAYCHKYDPGASCPTVGGVATDRVSMMSDAYAGDETRYTYGQAGRLTRAQVTGANPRTDQYGYDQAGNRTSEQVSGGTIIVSTFNTGNQLTLRGSQTATYDLAGNRVSAQNGQASPHNARGQAASLWDTAVTLGASYSGPGMGSRTQLGTVAYYNDNLGVAAETDGGTTTAYTRTPEGRVIGQRTPGGNYYLLGDRQDCVIRVIGPDGASRINWTYNPYGIRTASTGPGGVTVRWGFHGGYHDPTGHVKMGERYYSPYTGSFIEVEPLKNPEEIHGLIDYTYAAGDPVSYSDPSGLELSPVCVQRNARAYSRNPGVLQIMCQIPGDGAKKREQACRVGALFAVGAKQPLKVTVRPKPGGDSFIVELLLKGKAKANPLLFVSAATLGCLTGIAGTTLP